VDFEKRQRYVTLQCVGILDYLKSTLDSKVRLDDTLSEAI
jgi:hypothetical protein